MKHNEMKQDRPQMTQISRMVRYALMVLMIVMAGATEAWGQDLSGTYYLAFPGKVNKPSDGYNPATPASNYYLCPTEGYLYYQATNQCTTTDNGQPFLTTYKCKDGVYNADKAVWTLIKHTVNGQDYYYVKHVIDNKYLIYNGTIAGNRLRAHLESTNNPGTNALFKITEDGTYSGYYYFAPYGVNNYWLNLTEGNYNYLVGQPGKNDGPTVNGVRQNVNGTLGGWTEANNTSQVYLEAVPVAPPSFTINADGSVTISPVSGATVYYTTDDSDPKNSATRITYSSTISASAIEAATGSEIKAVAVDNTDNTKVSVVVTQALESYTYHIVNQSNKVAITLTVKQVVGKPLTKDYTSIHAAIRSSYISDEEVEFRSFSGDYAVGATVTQETLDQADAITETPSDNTNIYVTYTTNNLGNKFLHLRGARPLNLKYEVSTGTYNFLYINEGAVAYDPSSAASITTTTHLWYINSSISTGDPYDVNVQDASKTNFLSYSSSATPVFSLVAGTQTYFISANEIAVDTDNDDEPDYQDITLKHVTSGETFTVRVNTVQIPTGYHLIDKKGIEIFPSGKESTSADLAVPSEWFSPLVSKYHFWKATDFIEVNGAYKLRDPDPEADYEPKEITAMGDITPGEQIYITYDVSNAIDLNGRNKWNVEGKENKTYRLQFLNGVDFYQENTDAVTSDKKRKAIYPYSNGDAALYVYGTDKWQSDLASGASTRTRWLWYIEPANDPASADELDPYHVIISSYQNQTNYKYTVMEGGEEVNKTRNFHSYLRTYKPEGYDHIVTGVANDNPLATGGQESDPANSELATEYMILGEVVGGKTYYRLKTFNSIPLDLNGDGDTTDEGENERRTVHSFEQYWKNNPTVYNILDNAGMNVGEHDVNYELSDAQKDYLTGMDAGIPWHTYKVWANAAPWSSNAKASKSFSEGKHWLQTIETGEQFTFEETTLTPLLILIDQHGWEIVRLPLPSSADDAARYAAIRKYSSPMVNNYYYWKTDGKVPGYHKYEPTDPVLNSDVSASGNSEYYSTPKLGVEGTLPQIKDAKGNLCDLYVTYDVKPEYANTYAGAASKDETQASAFLVKQGGHYAKITDSNALASTSSAEEESLSIENAPANMRWYLRPNFDIDAEMGYRYSTDAIHPEGAKTKEETEADYVTDGKNGFDPYNLQIQSAKPETDRLFTTNSSGSALSNGKWEGTYASSSVVSLQNEKRYQISAEGYDQTTLKITNATFMVVDDGNGNMRLMPRFDNTKVVTSFTGLATQLAAAAEGDDGTGTQSFSITMVPTTVSKSSDIKSVGGHFLLSESFTIDTSVGTSTAPFKGIIDGQLHTSSGTANNPLVAYAEDAIIKNIIIDNADISSGTNVGAICNEAKGQTRIYNCGVNGGSIGGTNYVGGLVGLLDGSSRVINCYSYADITSGNYVGGIVGYNNVETSATSAKPETYLKTMVMNCMFYGDITGGTNKAPIYNGKIISNKFETKNNVNYTGVGNYNYFRSEASWAQNQNNINTPNCALMAEDRFLQRFEFFRHLMNSHRELAAWWATGDYTKKDEMMKWVLEPSQIGSTTPYPILKEPKDQNGNTIQYPSVVNIDAENAQTGQPRNKGGKLGTLTVNIQMGNGAVYEAPTGAEITTAQKTLNITDKDPNHFNFNYYKVQLPYYNDVGTKNYNGNRVVTGWKIVSITGGTTGSYTTGEDATTDANGNITSTPYNFADRKCTNKDLYSESGRVFNQGAYWDVPEGVTAITIEPYWARAVYLADAYADVVYNTDMSTAYNVPDVGGGQIYTNGSSYSIAGESQVVYTTMGNAIASSGTALFSGGVDGNKHTVYDYAVVLVGNYHHIAAMEASNSKPYTVTSVDLDGDNEPDYSYILRFNSRTPIHPVRADFINIPGLGMAQKSTGGTGSYNFGILQPKNFFESTNTSLFRVTQFEYDAGRDVTQPFIVQGGVFEQWVGGQQTAHKNKITYFHVGGNVWFKEFHRGCHQDKQHTTKHPPVSVTGGDYDEFYLTGLYRGDVNNYEDNAECYINGGRFGTVCGAAQEGIGKANGANNTGNIVWQIQNADITEFYAGGINAAHPVTGNISTTITGGKIDLYCGGPKFGDMSTDKKVVTNATNCEFGTFFGAGYGGNSFSRQAPFNGNNVTNINWNKWIKGEIKFGTDAQNPNFTGYKREYKSAYDGVSYQFDYQFLPMSDNKTNVARLWIEYVKFSLATTRNVTSTLTGCTVTGNFYGGGSLGKVDGDVTSTLSNCTMMGEVFGAGYSASLPTVEMDDLNGFSTEPYYYDKFGTYRKGVKGPTTTYRWEHGNSISVDNDNHILYTPENLTVLGTVTGKVTLNINGTTTVVGNVYGGGESSDVYGKDNSNVITSHVEVNILNGSMTDVYGGGKGENTIVGGDIEVNIGAKDGSGTLSGSGAIAGDVYGGSAFGAVNTASTKDADGKVTDYTPSEGKTTTVNIYGGTVTGSVFGGGKGQVTNSSLSDPKSFAAQNFGDATVNMEGGTVLTAVYGGSNIYGVLKKKSTVQITGGTIGTNPGESTDIKDVVFGGGFGEPTRVEGSIAVNIGREKTGEETEHVGTAAIYGSVYGGSALGKVNVDSSSDPIDGANIDVKLLKGTIYGNVFGGGLGQKAAAAVGTQGQEGYVAAKEAIAAVVGGDVNVLLDGAKLDCLYTGEGVNIMPLTGQIFGANNLNGTPKGHVKVHVKRTMDKTKDTGVARDSRTTYDVAAVYGGGNQADYIPTNATLDPAVEGNPAKIAAATAEVIIEGCDRTSIEYVYGGGNAAAVPATDVTILGSYIIDYVFGGGNGKSTATFTNPGANVGLYNNGTSYGSGKAVTNLVGCHAHYVFGGSNTLGNVRGGTSILMPDQSLYPAPEYNCCSVRDIGEIYGAGNEAEQDGNVTLILGCVHNMKNVYGGARKANVKGGIDLVVTSGTFEGVFGGNDMSGTIQGPITLTIEETGCDPLVIDNLYLGGNQAAYSIYGYKNTGNVDAPVLVARTKAEYDALTDQQKADEHLPYTDPELNVVSCTRIGKTSGDDLGGAFGGGLGTGAVMYGNPTVNINMIPGKFGTDTNSDEIPDALGTITNVYGGGKEANVEGNTTVNIGTKKKMAHRTSMGAEIPVDNRVEKDVLPAIITSNVFGAGKGLESDVNSALVTGNTTIVIASGTISRSVYGGGELSQVGGNTDITVSGGDIGDPTGEHAGEIYGNVYGGGKGNTANVRSGLVKGNTNITIENTVADAEYAEEHNVAVGSIVTSPSIYHNIYGGGAHGSVGTYTYASNADNAAISNHPEGDNGTANITITGGTIGINGHENGMVFGSSRGEVGVPDAICDKLAWVYSTNVVIGTSGQGTNQTSPHIKGSVYGGGENGHVYQNASVTIHSGMVGITDTSIDGGAAYPYRGNVYGAGCGTDKYWVDADNDDVKDDGEEHYNIKSGYVGGTASVTIDGGRVVRDVYGAGSMGSVNGSTTVTIEGNAEIGANGSGGGYVFAAARGDSAEPTMATVGSSNLNINGGTIWMDAYGGGQNGAVKGAVTVSMTGGTVKHDVYGGGALANTNTDNWVTDHLVYTYEEVTGLTAGTDLVDGYFTLSESAGSYTYTPAAGKAQTATTYYRILKATNVTMTGGTIEGNLYGGGLGQKTGINEATSDIAANVYSPVVVKISEGVATNVFGCNNINGAPQTAATVIISDKAIANNVYGGGNVAAFTGNTNVTMSDGTAAYVYGGGLGSTAIVTGDTRVAISGGTINNDVYGGGSEADVTGNVSVSVSGGKIVNDVYGGGALASTNTANWNWTIANSGEVGYEEVEDLVVETYRVKEVVEGANVGEMGLFIKVGDNYEAATGTAQPNTTYYEKLNGTPVAGYYADATGSVMYRSTTDIAVDGGHYYKKKVVGTWKEGYNDETTGTTYKTTVNLTGGLIGNAYGGGLGRQAVDAKPANGDVPAQPAVPAVAANVYGDVTITVNKNVDPNKGVTFIQSVEYPVINGTQIITPTSGRVFGCNNHNGTPTGNVEVHVYATRQVDEDFKIIAGHGSSNRKYTYEIQSVYGGGNQADYLPAEDKKSQVIIEGCDETSIEKVYGGGNSAVVPETDVLIKGTYDIGYAFGGGNGDKPIKKADGIWYENEGAIVIGMAKIVCQGGKIGQVFGGGDSKGSCGNTNAVTSQVGDCTLQITRLYGAGNKGDVAAVNIVLAACSDAAIEYVHGGSYNAHVTGDVHLTITSGILKNVYGGNDARGGIGGNIIIDIEETNGCNPIIIQNLVGGGNEAPYPGTHVVSNEEVPYDEPGKITVNVKSATRIDNIYGGCFMSEANADTEVNINMIKGNKAGKTVEIPKEFSYIPNISEVATVDSKKISCKINDDIGTIGNVFGGGNQGIVKGNTVVNIGSSDKVSIMKRNSDGKIQAKEGEATVTIDAENGSNITGKTILYDDNNTVLGAHITGNVFGGGELADVTGNTTVNICAKETSGTYAAVTEGDKKVTIAGNVYGGGKGEDDSFTCAKAMVGVVDNGVGDTKVVIGNGTISGNVFGGGEVGRVENDTEVMIGIGDPDTGSAPVVTGNVFGAGQGVETHGYSALVRGNSTVTIQGNAKVKANVYGGGEIGTVGKYWVTGVDYPSSLTPPAVPTGIGNGMPYATRSGGKCTVIVQGKAQIGPDDGPATATAGHVFGGGMGVETAYSDEGANRSKRMVTYDENIYTIGGIGEKWDYYEADKAFVWEYFEDKSKYLNFLQTLALVSDAELTITGNAKVKGNVYGGSQSGFLQRETDVKILSGEIGSTGSYGNVFGGGRGLPKYGSGEGLKDFDEAGQVKGDAKVTISGGTVHGSVYGGGELGFVGKFTYDKEAKTYSWSSYKTKDNVDVTESGACTVAISGSTTIKGHVFGAGKGSDDTFECEQAIVRTTSVTISAGTVGTLDGSELKEGTGNVYGGGKVGRVDQHAVVTLGVENASEGNAPDIKGNVYGAGQGVETHGYSGLARGNTTVTVQGTTKVGKSVYGGGEIAAVGRYGLDSSGMPSTLVSGGECRVKVQDHAVIGYLGGGNVYGGSKGVDESKKNYSYTNNDNRPKRMMSYSSSLYNDGNSGLWVYSNDDPKYVWEYFDTREKYLNFLQTLALATDTYLTIDENATVNGSAYGGSESGFVQRNTEVEIKGSSHIGTTSPELIGHVYGGGKGVSGFDKAGRVRGNTKVDIGGTPTITGNVYGGGELGFVGKFVCPDGRTYEWQKIRGKEDAADATTYDTGSCTVTITGGTIGYAENKTADAQSAHASGHVFGAGKGEALTFKCESALVKETNVSVNNATVYGNVYGGGEVGRVDLNTTVKIGDGAGSSGGAAAPDIKGSVFGAGAGADTHGYSALVRGNTTVTVEGNAKVKKNVYGGGEIAAVGKYKVKNAQGDPEDAPDDLPVGMPYSLESDGLGICNVTIQGYAEIGYDGAGSDAGHVFGASKGVVPSYQYDATNATTLANSSKRMTLYTNATDYPSDKIDKTWNYTDDSHQFIWEYFDTEDKYKTFLETLALATQANVNIKDNTKVKGNVYGGSENGFVQHHISVTIDNGEIGTTGYGDIYGGGKGLASFDVAGRVSGHVVLTVNNGTMHGSVYGGGELGIVKQDVTVNINGGTIDNNVYGGGALADTNTGNVTEGYGTASETIPSTATYKTTVNLEGGTIAHDAYGGALGQHEEKNASGVVTKKSISPKVYGDILVELNKTVAAKAVAATPVYEKGCIVEKIFGCNDMMGTPKGHVTVHVYATQHKNYGATIAADNKYEKYRKLSDYIDHYNDYISELDAFATTFGVDNTTYTSYKTDLEDTNWSSQPGSTDDEKKTNLLKKRNRALDNIRDLLAAKYDVLAVYGGGDLAPYEPADNDENTEVIIDGCELTSIKQVYGSGNAASTSACAVTIYGTYEIDELFGGGNGKDNYQLNDKWYENPGANVGYRNYTHYVTTASTTAEITTYGNGDVDNPYKAIENDGTDGYLNATTKEYRQANYRYGKGRATTDVIGGRIHNIYGGSNTKGNISTLALSIYETSAECTLTIDDSYGAGKDALIDGEARISLECVDYMANLYGGSTNSDVNSDVTLTVTNGVFGRVFGGNNTSGNIRGSITVNIKESGCKPIVIDELYAGGYLANYSIYGYYNAGTTQAPDWKPRTKIQFEEARDDALAELGDNPTEQQKTDKLIEKGLYGFPKADPRINVISATKIGEIYGGGYRATVVGNPYINVNMENGMVPKKYVDAAPDDFTATLHEKTATDGTTNHDYQYVVDRLDAGNAILALGTIGYIFGGGNEADILGNTHVDIGTGEWFNWETMTTETISRKAAKITGSVYGGGKMGNVGNFTKTDGKPTSCTQGTGKCYVTISNGEIGPDNMKMTASGGPDDAGHVFGAGQGTTDLLYDDNSKTEEKQTAIAAMPDEVKAAKIAALANLAYADYAEVTINGTAFVKGSVYGGSENGHVLHDTHVVIDGDCQIGNGYVQMDDNGTYLDRLASPVTPKAVNRRYTAEEWSEGKLKAALKDGTTVTDYYTSSLPECASWEYDKTSGAPYDPYAKNEYEDKYYYDSSHTKYAEGGSIIGKDGHTFYGNVFGGGSGYYPYAPGKWVEKAGWVEGNTKVEIKGGHILTNVYGGNEMTDVGHGLTGTGGKCTIEMTGGSLGVPRTLGQIANHPVTCYLFGAGKGDQRVFFNKSTNVKEVEVKISGDARIYGSVFGGGEDGHVQKDVTMTIEDTETTTTTDDGNGNSTTTTTTTSPYIGTWGTSYVDGNVFGGGRGFSGDAYTAGNVAGSVTMNIKGGIMLGSIYGGGRLGSVGYGLYAAAETDKYGTMRPDNYADDGTTPVDNFKRGYIDITISGGTIGNNYEFIMPNTTNIEAAGIAETDISKWKPEGENNSEWTIWKTYHHVPNTTYDTSNGRLVHTKGGNVYVGGMGRYTKLDGTTPISTYSNGELTSDIDWSKLGNVKQTKLTITGNPWIMGDVYGGGEMGAVIPYTSDGTQEGGSTTIDIQGGTIGTEITDDTPVQETAPVPENYPASGNSAVKYTYGSVYGGGEGQETPDGSTAKNHGGEVRGNTKVDISGDTKVRASVFGGGEMAIVGGNTYVTISGGEIGRNEVYAQDDSNPGYVKFGSSTMGNVFGGGKGHKDYVEAGLVKGNTNITIQNSEADAAYAAAHDGVSEGDVLSPKIYHNVYGGGALASVGTFKLSDGNDTPSYIHAANIPYDWENTDGSVISSNDDPAVKTPTGTATVTITGGTIGISGRDNGMVNGSSRGEISKPVKEGDILVDPYDRVAWVHNSFVNIGTAGAATGPTIKGSVYGGGENGHNSGSTTVNVKSGTVGIVEKTDPWIYFADETVRAKAQVTRGNVYGAGCGTDTYTVTVGEGSAQKKYEYHNPRGGYVAQTTSVNISGGVIANSVYGGGSLGSVGRILHITDTADVAKAKHADILNVNGVEQIRGFGLSWPYEFEFMDETGKTTVNITGGHIGAQVKNDDGTELFAGDGDVYGSARGEAGDRYATMHFAYVNESEVNVNYPTTADVADVEDLTTPCITGSVHGSGENGFVYGDTHVTLNEGLVGHSLYGGGKGKGTYQVKLNKIVGEGTYESEIYSLIAGKVFGNTNVTMNGGHVGRNVYGGGNMASVGKGNYASGTDDYYTAGYGETLHDSPLWTASGSFDPTAPITSTNKPTTMADYFLSSGKTTVKVLGGQVGVKTTELKNDLPLGNVFGGSAGEAAPNVPKDLSPRYHYCPAFFSGYVNETDVTIGDESISRYRCKTAYGEGDDAHAIGDCITAEKYEELSSGKENWEVVVPTILGSIYGGGQDGHVRRDTKVTVYRGEIGMAYGTEVLKDDKGNYITDLDDPQWLHRGNVYGAGSGISEYEFDFDNNGTIDGTVRIGEKDYDEKGYSTSAGSVTRFTDVNVLGGTIHRNVYGGGSMGSVGPLKIAQLYDPYKQDLTNTGTLGKQSQCNVTIGGAGTVTIGTPTDYKAHYGGEVYGASRGISEQIDLGSVFWTKVLIRNGANIQGNVFGGGDAGMVKKDTDVQIGDKAE